MFRLLARRFKAQLRLRRLRLSPTERAKVIAEVKREEWLLKQLSRVDPRGRGW